jgi:hypothetical protein
MARPLGGGVHRLDGPRSRNGRIRRVLKVHADLVVIPRRDVLRLHD